LLFTPRGQFQYKPPLLINSGSGQGKRELVGRPGRGFAGGWTVRPQAILCALAALGLLATPALSQSPASGSARPARLQPRGAASETAADNTAETIAPGTLEAMPTPEERLYYEGPAGEPILDGGACPPDCHTCCLSGTYIRAEYLMWSMRGMHVPPLVTTSPAGTSIEDAGVLGEEDTRILFGGETVNSDVESGGRITIGWWFDPCRRLGIEGEYFGVRESVQSFGRESTGNPILARPFFDIVQGVENATLTAFPDTIAGQISAQARTTLQGVGARAIYNLCCGDGCGSDCITGCPVQTGYRFDALLGYRFIRLDDQVRVDEASTSLDEEFPGAFAIHDIFDTQNRFHGVDLGTRLSWCSGCWSLDLLSKIALGNTRSRIEIDGSTTITEDEDSETFTGGILAQRTNIGLREFDEFAVVPELGVTVGYQLNPCWRATLGYTFLYWSRVARAGDQISRDLNTGLIPPEDDPVTTNLRPEFTLRYVDFWAQGMTVGLEGSW
jgi:hypothetical protein